MTREGILDTDSSAKSLNTMLQEIADVKRRQEINIYATISLKLQVKDFFSLSILS